LRVVRAACSARGFACWEPRALLRAPPEPQAPSPAPLMLAHEQPAFSSSPSVPLPNRNLEPGTWSPDAGEQPASPTPTPPGNLEAWKPRSLEAWKPGSLEAWKPTWKPENLENEGFSSQGPGAAPKTEPPTLQPRLWKKLPTLASSSFDASTSLRPVRPRLTALLPLDDIGRLGGPRTTRRRRIYGSWPDAARDGGYGPRNRKEPL
jgi:hypothetical protein